MPFGYGEFLRSEGLRETTIDEHVRQVTYFFTYLDRRYKSQKELYEINPSDIKDYLEEKKVQELKLSSRKKILSILKRFFHFSWKTSKISIDPAVKIELVEEHVVEHEDTQYELLRDVLYDLIRSNEPDKRIAIYCLALHGLRPEEFKVKVANLRDRSLEITHPGHERVIALDDLSGTFLRNYVKGKFPTDFILESTGQDGTIKAVERMTIGLNLKKVAKKYNLGRITTNEIRRSYAAYLVNQEKSYDQAAMILGIDKISLLKLLGS
ncbi:site-specific integrase [Paenalkalicoccus suaedae]|uniref:Site-specific integrase n=1 Tax=Paenalkalicoccus suaedae TaxID=2592382 RepID=A0A859FEJ3_9BACI|nr:site-specific integrase [Paenalkalicoccus suaedae]QKS71290.1 site-specific integrase [Paenalkalicoccus suaedae]